jgi:hypothetical protein
LAGGLLGAYVFGVFVLLAGLAVALAFTIEACASSGSSTT